MWHLTIDRVTLFRVTFVTNFTRMGPLKEWALG